MEYVSIKNLNTQLGIPATALTSNPELALELNKIYNALRALGVNLDLLSGDPIATIEATELIIASSAVNLYNVAGTLKARNANATDHTKPCMGIAPAAIASGGFGKVTLRGFLVIGGVTPGTLYYTSTTSGQITATKPAGAGNLVQCIGFGLDATTIYFNPEFSGV